MSSLGTTKGATDVFVENDTGISVGVHDVDGGHE